MTAVGRLTRKEEKKMVEREEKRRRRRRRESRVVTFFKRKLIYCMTHRAKILMTKMVCLAINLFFCNCNLLFIFRYVWL